MAENADIVPPPPPSPPPPPPPPAAGEEDEDAEDDLDIQDAEYWTRLAQSPSASGPSSTAASSSKEPAAAASGTSLAKNSKSALYLDTINRAVLDFDFEKLCSVSLSNINVYACLVCGKYFQGRGRNSYAYLHSIDTSHHVFMNLATSQTYILPDNYAVPEESQAALQDIKYLLNPTFDTRTLATLDEKEAYDLNGTAYSPGFVGLNNVGKNDYVNVVVQALVHVRPLRDFFLRQHEAQAGTSELVARFGALVRKIWNPRAFKPQVSPHEFLQQVAQVSHNRFKITEQADPVEFLGWLLNRLHADLASPGGKGAKRKRTAVGVETIISRCFQGVVQVESQPLEKVEKHEDDAAVAAQAESLANGAGPTGGQVDGNGRACFDPAGKVERKDSPFFLLSMDLPTPPPVLGTDGDDESASLVPQVTIGQLLAKYDGTSLHASHARLSKYQLRRLPPFLVLHFRRFTKNSLGQTERNPTLVNFPTTNLDVSRYAPLLPAADAMDTDSPIANAYDLVANVVYDATPGTVNENAAWKSHVHTSPANRKQNAPKWFAIHDLIVDPIDPHMIFLAESHLQIWQKRSSSPP